MDYALLKTFHQLAVVISFAGFFVRGVGMLNDATWLRHRSVKMLPHVVDTILIVSAVWLAWILRLTPTNAPWIGAKIIGLLVYIAVGMVALRFGRTKPVRASAWIGAMLVFGYVVSVAIAKDPRGFLLWL